MQHVNNGAIMAQPLVSSILEIKVIGEDGSIKIYDKRRELTCLHAHKSHNVHTNCCVAQYKVTVNRRSKK